MSNLSYKTLLRFSKQIRRSLDLHAILGVAVEEIYSVLQLDRCSFLWYVQTNKIPEHGFSEHSFPEHSFSEHSFPEYSCPYWEVVREEKNHALSDLRGRYCLEFETCMWQANGLGTTCEQTLDLIHKLRTHQSFQIHQANQIDSLHQSSLFSFLSAQSILILPIQTCTKKIGALICAHVSRHHVWPIEEIEMLQEMTEQLEASINQAELYTESCRHALTAQTQALELKHTLEKLQQTQSELIHHRKMSSIGNLASGMAHEINNPLTFIQGNLVHATQYSRDLLHLVELCQQSSNQLPQALQDYLDEIDIDFIQRDFPELLNSMKIGTQRIENIIQSLRTFSHLDQTELKTVDIHKGIDSVICLIQTRFEDNDACAKVQLIQDYGKLPKVECFANQLNQVFMHLITNAIEALEGVCTHPSLQQFSSFEPQVYIQTKQIYNDRILISISDNGPGMPSVVMHNLFNPFMTTKQVGKGEGLGLYISYQIIVQQHGGKLRCESHPGEGTEFQIELPVRQISTPKMVDLLTA